MTSRRIFLKFTKRFVEKTKSAFRIR